MNLLVDLLMDMMMCIYRSPTKEKHLSIETTTGVYKVIEEAILRDNTHMLICGNFNYPDIDWENDFVREKNTVIRPFINMVQTSTYFRANKILGGRRTKPS